MTKLDPRAHRSTLARALFPDLAAHAARAASVDPVELWIEEQTEELRFGAHGTALARFPEGSDSAALAAAFAVAVEIAGDTDTRAPEPEDFFAAGISPHTPSAAADLIPIVAPHGLGAAAWERVFASTLRAAGPRLALSSEARRWFAALDHPTEQGRAAVHTRTTAGAVRWTLRWLPAGEAPPHRGAAFRVADSPAYPTLPEILTLQRLRLARAARPVDHATFTWLAGELPDPRFAARHGYDEAEHTIRLSTRERTDQGAHVGVRPALTALNATDPPAGARPAA